MAFGLHVDSEENGPITVFRIDGRLDASSAPTLEAKIDPSLNKEGAKLLLDFSQVEYLSSAGMRLLLNASKKAKNSGGAIAFCSINDDVMEIIKMAGFERILSIFPSEEAAAGYLTDVS